MYKIEIQLKINHKFNSKLKKIRILGNDVHFFSLDSANIKNKNICKELCLLTVLRMKKRTDHAEII